MFVKISPGLIRSDTGNDWVFHRTIGNVSGAIQLMYGMHHVPESGPCLISFINARRRIVQPMIDQSNRAGKSAELIQTFSL
ncbi:hypothetical protein WA026_023154 [Henosepilachna vigintioctopunctata]|uniref:Uncharacterized protein n=1 Tax=Henosepilachna vigintioctopunctata TaxID=420089 RepID=A0AAW1TPZ0_9CUCU